ncbi:MAG: hypothetical protein J6T76_02890 [Paludibacteraceae bacterium]|nr:hypothetical protein [Paludibacteraceae bacterium]
MKQFFTKFLTMAVLVMSALSIYAVDYQLPNSGMDDWNGTQFDGKIQLTSWQASNVKQSVVTENFITRETGRSNYCAVIENKKVGVNLGIINIQENVPGYFTLGLPWQYVPNNTDSDNATGGTDGGIDFSQRPDSLSVWIKRDGSNPTGENYSVLFYSWKGTSKGDKYRSKDKKACTSTSHTNEESDIRQAMDANDCSTTTQATQVAEGFWFEKKKYSNWTQIKVPIYYLNDNEPQKCNVIFSSSGYPNFRNADGIVVGNKLYVDDVQLIYSSKIQQLYIGGKVWNGFNPNTSEEQTYSVGHTTEVPEIYAVRGAGTMKNIKGNQAVAPGRKLTSSEMTIKYGQVDGEPTVITVKAADGSSTTTYKIKMVQAASENATLSSILVNGTPISGFQPQLGSYNVVLPYGTTAAPEVTVVKAEDKQTVSITQATSPTGKATINVTAADGKTKKTYTINFSVAQLSDNTLTGIKVNGEEIPGFTPTLTVYTVELPLGTTTMPTVEAISAYPAGAQTITYKAPDKIDGGQYQISVTTPGNSTAKVYKLNFVLTASTNSKLKDLQMEGYDLEFNPNKTTYYVNLPMGTTTLPKVTYTPGDSYQKVVMEQTESDGKQIITITVTAASGAKTVYRIICSIEQSEASHLNMIYIGGVALEGFNPNTTSYTYELTPGTTELPTITYDKGDEYEEVTITYGGLNGTTKITVKAGNGNTTVYRITFSLELSADVTLKAIYLDGKLLDGFQSEVYSYSITLPRGTTELPAITWEKGDETQSVNARYGGVNGDTKITVRAQSGASVDYILKFRVFKDTVNCLDMIYLDGKQLEGFHKDTLNYIDSLPVGVSKVPAVTWDLTAESSSAKLLMQGNQRTIRVTAESGAVRDYVISFIIRKSENAFLKMIYIGGQPLEGFDPKELEYSYEFDGETAPEITVEKDGNQQVIILAPVGAGTATIIVSPDGGGEGNTYTINLRQKPKAAVQLVGIQLDGEPMDGFRSDKLDYTIDYSGTQPVATCTAADGQTVNSFAEKNTVRFVVTADGEQAIYTIKFNQLLSNDATLAAILFNGVAYAEFKPATYNYAITLPAGSSIPEITYTPNHAEQFIMLGQTGENSYAINVRAEDGTTTATYALAFTIEQFTTTELEALMLNGTPLALEEGVYTYNQTIDAGAELPELGITAGGGQTIMTLNTSETQQQIIVESEDGQTATYTINYTPVYSSNALLTGIELDGTPLEGFASTTYEYTHELAWRTQVVPVIRPIGATPNQVIEIHYGAINAKTHIHVTAADKTTTADYYINFPVVKSSNVALQSVAFELGDIDFNPEVTDYVIDLPYQTTAVPGILYAKAEPEQNVKFVSAPISGTTQLIVTAENGDTRTYNFTFNVPASPKANVLDTLYITTNKLSNVARAIAADETDITIDLPYGTTSLNFGYHKLYDEQAVLVQQGGIFNPTIITVKANRGDEADKVYTITPNIETQNPAVLEGITINGAAFAGFDKNRFSYVVNVTASPIVVASGYNGATVSQTISNSKHWQANVTKDGYTNTYDLWFYYPADVIPNNEFKNWSSATTFTEATKPTGWNTIADALGSHYVFMMGTFKPSSLLSKDGSSVHLTSKYSVPGGGNIPGFITLGTVSGNWGVAGSSNFAVSGGITFRNSPDVMTVSAKINKVKENAQILYTLVGASGSKTLEFKESATSSSYKTYTYNLSAANSAAGAPSQLNIVLNSYYQVSGTTGSLSDPADMYVNKISFVYSSALSKVKVNGGAELEPTDNTFAYTLPSAETTGIPELTFIGAVSDQAQKIVWNNTDPKALSRTATVTNYAEDGTSTIYTVEITRPKSAISTLADLKIDGMTVTGWSPSVLEYQVPVACGQKRLHDVQAVQGSNLQTVAMSAAGDVVTIAVTAESGATKTYKVTFVEQKSDDVTLTDLVAVGTTLTYDAAVTEYATSAATMPEIKFVKKSDGQTVTLDGGKLYIVAEDGVSKDTITITNTPLAVVTTGQLSDLSLDDITIEGFDAATYTYSKPEPESTSFVRAFATDTVLQTITPDSITWLVKGNEQHTYSLVYPKAISAESAIETILINGEPMPGFDPAVPDEYPYYSNEPVTIQVVAKPGQTISASISVEPVNAAPRRASGQAVGLRYTLDVTAENGINTATYIIKVLPKKSDDASLKMIRLDGADLEGFTPAQTRYVVTLPSANPKIVEPKHPSVMYIANDAAQAITLDTNQENDTTYHYIYVTSEDGMNEMTYELLITSEPSHNALITALMLDGQMVEDFSPERTNYSSWVDDMDVDVVYSAADRFLTVDTTLRKDVLTLHVVAQDKVNTNDYTVKLYQKPVSTDVTLANILLNGQSFTDYDAALMPFTPMNSYYTIPIASNQNIPDVRPVLNSNDQTADIDNSRSDTVLITVYAADGIHSNTYVLFFKKEYSANVALANIEVGDSALTLVPGQLNYTFVLPVGEKQPRSVTYALQDYDLQSAENEGVDGMTWSVDVVAENGTRVTYTVTFVETLSQNAELSDITANDVSIEGFAADQFNYVITLPQGERRLPAIRFYEGDQWQRPQVIDTVATTLRTTYNCHVLAEDSIHRSTYKVEINILPSNVDTLAGILVNNRQLEGFDPYQPNYTYTLPAGTTELPAIELEPGDEYQTIDSVSTGVGGTMTILVTAENGSQRRYFIHFVTERDNNSTLTEIACGGQPLEDFYPETFDYTVNLPYGMTTIPVVTFTKATALQQAVLTVEGDVVTIIVTAEDGTQSVYTITFIQGKSTEAHLESVTVDGQPLEYFDPNTFDYTIILPYGTTDMPEVTATLVDTTATIEILADGQTVTITTLSADGRTPYEYIITFVIEGCPINYLNDIKVNGVTIEGFTPDSIYYIIAYPVGSDSTAFVTADAITYETADPTEEVVVSSQGEWIFVTVMSQSGVSRIYMIQQVISMSDNCLLADLLLNGVTIDNFADSVFNYEYLLLEGETLPMIDAVAQDSLAEISITPGAIGEPTLIYCTAQDGTENVYSVVFRVSPINTALQARPADVLLKQIDGTETFAAFTIRVNTSIAIYDQYGHLFFNETLPVCNPNDVTIATDATGREILTDASGDGLYFTIPAHGQTFFYLFYSDGKNISSGKFMIP